MSYDKLTSKELELEIINYDKQKVITVALKLFESNKDLAEKLTNCRIAFEDTTKNMRILQEELKRIDGLGFWATVNRWLFNATERKRARNLAMKEARSKAKHPTVLEAKEDIKEEQDEA